MNECFSASSFEIWSFSKLSGNHIFFFNLQFWKVIFKRLLFYSHLTSTTTQPYNFYVVKKYDVFDIIIEISESDIPPCIVWQPHLYVRIKNEQITA